jgi:hypothetical protein
MTDTKDPPDTPDTTNPAAPTMQVIRLTTTDGIAHEFFGPSLLRNNPDGPDGYACLQSVDFGPELTIQQVQEILAYHALYPNPATDHFFN